MNWDNGEVPKNSLRQAAIGFALIKSWGITESISTEAIFSLIALSILINPILNWFSTSSPTDLSLRFPRWSMSSTSPFPSFRSSICLTIVTMSSFLRTVNLGSQSRSILAFIFTRPVSERSYLVWLKNRLPNKFLAVSIVGGSPGLKTR